MIYLKCFLACLFFAYSYCVTANGNISNDFDSSLKRLGAYSYGVGGALTYIGYSNYLIDRQEENLKLASWGLGLGIVPILIEMIQAEKGIASYQLIESSDDMRNVNSMLSLSAIYSIYGLSRDKSILANALLSVGILGGLGGTLTREGEVQEIFCLSSYLGNQLIPQNWDQNSVFLANVGLYLLVHYLTPSDVTNAASSEMKDGSNVLVTPFDTRLVWNYIF